MFALGMHIFEPHLDDRPVEVEPWMIQAIVYVALLHIHIELSVGFATGAMNPTVEHFWESNMLIDAGFYSLGKMAERLLVQITKRDAQRRLI